MACFTSEAVPSLALNNVCGRHSLNIGFVCVNEYLFYKTHSCPHFILQVAGGNVSQGPASTLLISHISFWCRCMADDQVLTAWVCVGSVYELVCVKPHTHTYGNTVDREGGYCTAKCTKIVLTSFLLEFNSILKEFFSFMFCITSFCLSACLFDSLSVCLSIYLEIYPFFAIW